MSSRSGLTLVELVVVLLILVLVAGTAITASEGLVGETRYETTRTSLRNIERAMLGAFDSSSSGEPTSISFAADIGRLPKVVGTDPQTALAEMWSKPEAVEPFAIQLAPGDPDVRLPGGWRGPYVRVPIGLGETYLHDGWGRTFQCLQADGATLSPIDTEIAMLRSLGANGMDGGMGYDADLTLTFISTESGTTAARHLGAVPVRVTNTGTEDTVFIRIYGPREGRIVTLDQVDAKAVGQDFVHVFESVPVGPRVVRAYLAASAPVTTDSVFEETVARSRSIPVTVVQGGIPEVLLELP